jgi:hypothetical protein
MCPLRQQLVGIEMLIAIEIDAVGIELMLHVAVAHRREQIAAAAHVPATDEYLRNCRRAESLVQDRAYPRAEVVLLIRHGIQVYAPEVDAQSSEELSNGPGELTPLECEQDDGLLVDGVVDKSGGVLVGPD